MEHRSRRSWRCFTKEAFMRQWSSFLSPKFFIPNLFKHTGETNAERSQWGKRQQVLGGGGVEEVPKKKETTQSKRGGRKRTTKNDNEEVLLKHHPPYLFHPLLQTPPLWGRWANMQCNSFEKVFNQSERWQHISQAFITSVYVLL